MAHGEGLRHGRVGGGRHLRVAVHRVEALVRRRVVLVAAARRRVDVAHQSSVTRAERGGRQRLVKLLLLFAILGASILEPDLAR